MASSSQQIAVSDDNKEYLDESISEDGASLKRCSSLELLDTLINEGFVEERKPPDMAPRSSPVESESKDVVTSVSSDNKNSKVKDVFQKSVGEIFEGFSCDNNDNVEEALKLYVKGLEGLFFVKKWGPKSKHFQEVLVTKIRKILNRAEQIKTMLNEKKNFQVGKDSSALSTAQSNTNPPECVWTERPTLKFDDVVGLNEVKDTFKEYVILPLRYPHLFTEFVFGSLKRTNEDITIVIERNPSPMPVFVFLVGKSRHSSPAILLYGAPGVGKTMLSRALGGELSLVENITYIRASVYEFMSKFSEGEKEVKQLFLYANEHAPCVMVLDDFEAISSDRDETQLQRRVKTEFLVQFEARSPQTIVIALTLSPWTISAPVRKRFAKRVHVPLPTTEERKELFKKMIEEGNLVPPPQISDEDLDIFAQRTEGYTGSDISVIVRESLMVPVREVQNSKHFKNISVEEDNDPDKMVDKFTACCLDDEGAMEMEWTSLETTQLYLRPLQQDDVLLSIEKSKPTISTEELEKFDEFTENCT